MISSLKLCAVMMTALIPSFGHTDVKSSSKDGFQIRIEKTVDQTPELAYSQFTKISSWWDAAHTYSGDSKNLSLDFQKCCFFEKLKNGGFVRHMEIVYCEPGKKIRMTGGLGPLQEMGIHGALTVSFQQKDDQTQIVLLYNVVGHSGLSLQNIAPAVNKVLDGQMDRLVAKISKKK